MTFRRSSRFGRLHYLRLRTGQRFCRAEKRSRERLEQSTIAAIMRVQGAVVPEEVRNDKKN
jgi:hypothetical protein